MEFKDYTRIESKMTKRDKKGRCGIECEDCPLSNYHNKRDLLCTHFRVLYPEEAEAIVQKWEEEHITTRAEKIRELFPDVDMVRIYSQNIEYPNLCPKSVDINFKCLQVINCGHCRKEFWNEEISQ